MSTTIPQISLTDNLRLNAFHFFPYLARGVVTENESRYRFWTRRQQDPGAVELIGSLREKYDSEYLYVRLFTDKALLVLCPRGVQRVLDQSPGIYAPADQKVARMSHFQPDALTISSGDRWRERRRFNTAVLDPERGAHPDAQAFLEIVRGVIDDLPGAGGEQPLTWGDLDRAFGRIMVQILFGAGSADDGLADALGQMMLESNAVMPPSGKSKHFDTFYAGLRARLSNPRSPSLAARCARTPASAATCVENQVPHWMFALKDTLGINTARALALIASHEHAEARVREELAGADPGSARDVDGLRYLEACIQEAMRLWPSTTMLVRKALADDSIEGRHVPAGTQVILHNGFSHRDARRHEFADRLHPQQWLEGGTGYAFNHLSNGPQVCAGKALALFVAKAVLATLLARARYRLLEPALDSARPLPYGYDHYGLSLQPGPLEH